MERERTVLAIDHGTRRIGLAIAGPMGVILPLPILEVAEGEDSTGPDVVASVVALVEGREVTDVIVGIPKHHDPKSEDRCEAFARRLEEALGEETPVHRQDEALSSWEAEKGIRARGARRYDKGRIDQAAAAIILRDWIAKREGRDPAAEAAAALPETGPEAREKVRRRARRDASGERRRKGGGGSGGGGRRRRGFDDDDSGE